MVCMHVSGSAAEYPPWQEPHWEEPTHAAYPCSAAPAVVSPFCWGNGFGGLSALIKLYKGQQFSPNDYVSLLLSVARCLSPRTENSGLWGVQPLAPPWVWCRCVRPGTSMASHSWIVSVFHSHCHPSLRHHMSSAILGTSLRRHLPYLNIQQPRLFLISHF